MASDYLIAAICSGASSGYAGGPGRAGAGDPTVAADRADATAQSCRWVGTVAKGGFELMVSERGLGGLGPRVGRAPELPPPPPLPQAIERAHAERRLAALGDRASALEGQAMLLLVTVHADSAMGAAGGLFCGRIIVPRLQAGTPADQWFMLQAGIPYTTHARARTPIHFRLARCRRKPHRALPSPPPPGAPFDRRARRPRLCLARCCTWPSWWPGPRANWMALAVSGALCRRRGRRRAGSALVARGDLAARGSSRDPARCVGV